MEELKFPVIKGHLPPAKWLSMDDYLRFVNLILKYTFDKKSSDELKKLHAVNVPFSLK